MSVWAELMGTALVGTDRRGLSPVEGDPAVAVLDRVAGWAAYRRAGVMYAATPAPVTEAPPERLPLVAEAAGRRLATLLDADGSQLDAASRQAMLGEWLAVAAERGRRVPPTLLPALLDHGRRQTSLRERIVAVGGARVRWLAAQNPDWSYLTAVESTSDDPDAWTTGSAGQRVGYLRQLRVRDPDGARDLLVADWPALTPDERGDLVSALATGLAPADEPLLERALDDRRREVRDAAARLLAQLPDSAYCRRMVARATAHVPVTGPVSAPTACDPGMRRDGIAPRPPTGTGERAWWLEEILARTPLPTWTSIAALVDDTSEWATTVHRGLARAAAAQGSRPVATAVLDRLGPDARDRDLAASLLPLLDPAELVGRAVDALRPESTTAWGPLLINVAPPWPDELATACLRAIEALAARRERTGDLQQLSRLAAVRLAPDRAAEAAAIAERLESTVDRPRAATLTALATLLRFRHEMTLEIG